MTTLEARRLRWGCRRGLLELDIVLNRFWDAEFSRLDADGRAAFARILEYADNDLWYLITTPAATIPDGQLAIIQKLREV